MAHLRVWRPALRPEASGRHTPAQRLGTNAVVGVEAPAVQPLQILQKKHTVREKLHI